MDMEKRDFSIRIEIDEMLNKLGITMSEEKVDQVVDAVSGYDSFLAVVGRYIIRGIEEVVNDNQIPYNQEKLQGRFELEGKGVNYEEI